MTILLLSVNVAIWLVQWLYGGKLPNQNYLELSNRGIYQGYYWQLITFQFLHGGFWHLLFNCLAIFFFGRMVEDRLGKSTFLKIYFLSGTVGGLFHVLMGALFPQQFGAPVLGASAGAFGLIAAATMLEPNSTILISFFIPLRAKYFLIGAIAISVLYMVFDPNSHTAHAAHLGGILAGVAYMRWGAVVESFLQSVRPRSDFIRVQASRGRRSRGRGRRTAEMPPEEFISREVDPILDKISAHGIQSLTPHEKEILEAARAKMEERR